MLVVGSNVNEETNDKKSNLDSYLAINSQISRDEQIYTRLKISGCDCLVQAIFHNGLIKGQVSVAVTSQQVKFDLNPVLNERFHAVNILNEIKRLYFNVECDQSGNLYLKLITKNKAQYQNDKNCKSNFIVKMRGLKNYMSSLEIFNDVENKEFVVSTNLYHTMNLK